MGNEQTRPQGAAPQGATAPSPPRPAPARPSVPPAPATARPASKRAALLFGINYAGSSAPLQGCVNDVNNIAALLVSSGKFAVSDVAKYTDGSEFGKAATSLAGMTDLLRQVAARSLSENLELVYVHFSGHGCQLRDATGDESDGLDEAIVPSDYERAGVLTDDWLHGWARAVNPRTKLVVVFDACHSGTALDLRADPARSVVFVSGCTDEQTSADAFIGGFGASGAMTSHLITALRKSPALWLDAGALVAAMRDTLARDGFTQRPVLTTTSTAAKVPFIA